MSSTGIDNWAASMATAWSITLCRLESISPVPTFGLPVVVLVVDVVVVVVVVDAVVEVVDADVVVVGTAVVVVEESAVDDVVSPVVDAGADETVVGPACSSGSVLVVATVSAIATPWPAVSSLPQADKKTRQTPPTTIDAKPDLPTLLLRLKRPAGYSIEPVVMLQGCEPADGALVCRWLTSSRTAAPASASARAQIALG